jgi:predicted nucleic acid-binding protein
MTFANSLLLLDTSVWIEAFKKGASFRLESICSPEQIVMVLPVYQEVLQGIKDENAFRKASLALRNSRFVENPMTAELFDEAIALYRLSRKQGLTVRSSVDCLIAAAAIRNGLILLHKDRDYASLARISNLQQRQL